MSSLLSVSHGSASSSATGTGTGRDCACYCVRCKRLLCANGYICQWDPRTALALLVLYLSTALPCARPGSVDSKHGASLDSLLKHTRDKILCHFD
jgi:hypothetical protein